MLKNGNKLIGEYPSALLGIVAKKSLNAVKLIVSALYLGLIEDVKAFKAVLHALLELLEKLNFVYTLANIIG